MAVVVQCPFVAVPWVSLSVFITFPGHTPFFYLLPCKTIVLSVQIRGCVHEVDN